MIILKKLFCFLLTLTLYVGLNTQSASAEIEKQVISGQLVIDSVNIGNVKPLNVVTFSRTEDSPIVHIFSLRVFKGDSDFWKFTKQPAILSIQDKQYSLDLIQTNGYKDNSLGCVTWAMFFVLGDYADALARADSATITFHFDNKPDIIWQIPKPILNEWEMITFYKR